MHTTTAPICGRTIPNDRRRRIITAAQQIATDPTGLSLLMEIGEPLGIIPDVITSDDLLKAIKLSREQVGSLLTALEACAVELDAQQDVDDESTSWGNQVPSIPNDTLYVPCRSIRSCNDSNGVQYAIALDGVAQAEFFDTAHRARLEVDRLCFTHSIGLELHSTETKCTAEVIAQAYDLSYWFFRTREVRKSLDKAHALLTDPDPRWFIDRDGQTIMVLPASGTKAYQVRDTCTCDDVWRRNDQHGGMCKHFALRVLLALCQMGGQLRHLPSAIDAAATRWIGPAEPAPEACIELPTTALLAAGGFARILSKSNPALPVHMTIVDQALTVVVGDHHTTVRGSDGVGQASLTLDNAEFTAFWTTFRPYAAQDRGSLQVFIDSTSLNVFAAGAGDFKIAVPGTY